MSTAIANDAAPDAARRSRLRPFCNFCRAVLSNRKATAGAILLAVCVFMAAAPGLIAPGDPNASLYMPGQGPSGDNLLGTTSYGQDIFTQFVWGARASLVIAVVAGLLSTVISALVGVAAGYFGGILDDFLSLVTDVFLVIPAFPLVVVIADYSKEGGNAIIIAVLVATGWSYGARQLRAQVL